jgi:hypothetical protein
MNHRILYYTIAYYIILYSNIVLYVLFCYIKPYCTILGGRGYMLMYATQSPLQAFFLELRPYSEPLPVLSRLSEAELMQQWQSWPDHMFLCDPGRYLDDTCVDLGVPGVLVHLSVAFGEPGQVIADGKPDVFATILALYASERAEQKAKQSCNAPGADTLPEDIMDDYPWLREYLRPQPGVIIPPGAAGDTGGGSSRQNIPVDLCPEELDSVWEVVEAKRREWVAADSESGDDFVMQVRGGPWTLLNKGTATDRIVSQAKKGLAPTWCSKYGLNKLASFSFSKYGERGASQLARQWCSRMQHYYDLWLFWDQVDYIYTDVDHFCYEEDNAFQAFAATLVIGEHCHQRLEATRALRPGRLSYTILSYTMLYGP